jgi:hypothetical protein
LRRGPRISAALRCAGTFQTFGLTPGCEAAEGDPRGHGQYTGEPRTEVRGCGRTVASRLARPGAARCRRFQLVCPQHPVPQHPSTKCCVPSNKCCVPQSWCVPITTCPQQSAVSPPNARPMAASNRLWHAVVRSTGFSRKFAPAKPSSGMDEHGFSQTKAMV